MIAFLINASIVAKSQNIIKGRVFEILNNEEIAPLPYANVVWKSTNIGVISDDQGNFSINVPKSKVNKEIWSAILVITHVGYKTFEKDIGDITNGLKSELVDIFMTPTININEINVKGKINTTNFSVIDPINIQTISTGELEKAACCNLSESFSTNGSVDVVFADAVSGSKQSQMLGLDGIHTQITQENMPLIWGMSSSFGLSFVPGTWIESIQIIKGSGSVVNGFEALTGQINLELYKPLNSPKLFWNMYTNQHGKFENNLILTKSNGVWKSNLFTHVSYFDREIDHNGNINSSDLSNEGDTFLDLPKSKQINMLNRWEYTGNKNYHLQFTGRSLIDERIGGQISITPNRYVVDVHNDLIELSSKIGSIQPNSPGKSTGIQSSFKIHNQKAKFGINEYDANQNSIFINIIRQTFINNTNNTLKYGFSYYADKYTESFSGNILNIITNRVRTDVIPGLFTEYNLKIGDLFNFTSGLRADYYNQNRDIMYLPRMNIKYNPNEKTVLRLSTGKSFRIANIFAENLSLLASNRNFIIQEELHPEIAWNYGLNITYCFYLNGREGTLNFDFYRTDFENQVIVDIENISEVNFYNLKGKSFSNSIQSDFMYEISDRFDFKVAYKINNVISTFNNEEKTSPLTSKNRLLFNMSYATNFDRWMYDFTINRIGESRIPEYYIEGDFVSEQFSSPFYLLNAQITKKFRKFDWYFGGENLSDFTQDNPIIGSENPNQSMFDASLIYAPINGRMFYTGFRFKIK